MAPACSSATSTTRSPRAALAEALRQNASALPRVSGSMKPTDAPPSTQSRSTSLSPSISRSLAVSRCRTLNQLGQFICGSSSADPIACPRFPACSYCSRGISLHGVLVRTGKVPGHLRRHDLLEGLALAQVRQPWDLKKFLRVFPCLLPQMIVQVQYLSDARLRE